MLRGKEVFFYLGGVVSVFFCFFFFFWLCTCFTNCDYSYWYYDYSLRYLVFNLLCEIKFKLFFILYFPHMHLWFVFSISGIYRLILLLCCYLFLQLIDSRFWLNCSRTITGIELVLELSNSCLCMFYHGLLRGEIVRF